MHRIQLDDVSVKYAGTPVFAGVDWAIGDRDRTGIVGPNGAGKSSLLKLIAGAIEPDRGQVTRQRGITSGYLPQDVVLGSGRTLIDEATALPPALAEVERDLATWHERLADPAVFGDERKLARTLARQEEALARYERLGGARHAGRTRALLSHLGFGPDDYERPAESLSGGQKKLVALVRLAAQAPDVLLLDEPDNHLDLEAKRLLEDFIRDYDGAVILVSHDRFLLDETVDRIAELEDGRLTLYPGNYSAYATERELRRMRQKRVFASQQREIARIEASIRRFEEWASRVVNERHIRQARSRRKMLERMEARGELVEKVVERRRMALSIDGGRGSDKSLEMRGVAMGFGDDCLFRDLDLLIRHGERIGLIGPNGAGKSVLLGLALGKLAPLSGSIRIGPSTRVGHYAQEHQTLDAWLERTPLELVRDVAPMREEGAVSFLLKFLFSYEQVRQPIHTLSGGERSRLQLAALMLEQPNLLLLDEPTNNLDIPSAEVLETALEQFEGAALVVSHDRYFLDRVVDRVIQLEDGSLRRFEGGYSEYLDQSTR